MISTIAGMARQTDSVYYVLGLNNCAWMSTFLCVSKIVILLIQCATSKKVVFLAL